MQEPGTSRAAPWSSDAGPHRAPRLYLYELRSLCARAAPSSALLPWRPLPDSRDTSSVLRKNREALAIGRFAQPGVERDERQVARRAAARGEGAGELHGIGSAKRVHRHDALSAQAQIVAGLNFAPIGRQGGQQLSRARYARRVGLFSRARRAKAETHSIRVPHHTTIAPSLSATRRRAALAGSAISSGSTAEPSQYFTSLPHARRAGRPPGSRRAAAPARAVAS